MHKTLTLVKAERARNNRVRINERSISRRIHYVVKDFITLNFTCCIRDVQFVGCCDVSGRIRGGCESDGVHCAGWNGHSTDSLDLKIELVLSCIVVLSNNMVPFLI